MSITKNAFLHASICLKSKSWGARKFLFQSRFPPFQSTWSTFTLFNWKTGFNAKCLKWCTNDKVNTEFELDNITTTVGYIQMLNKPANFINESSACVDLIFSSNTGIVKNCGYELWVSPRFSFLWRRLGLQTCWYWKYLKSYFNVWLVWFSSKKMQRKHGKY